MTRHIAVSLATVSLVLAFLPSPLPAADRPAADPHAIEGVWQLVAASPVAPDDIDPHGMLNQKLYLTADGKIYLMRPEETFSAGIPSAHYEYDGTTRKVTMPDGSVRSDPAQIAGDTMKVTMRDGQVLTYRRVAGEHALERSLAPISVEVVSGNASPLPPEPKYDDADHSKQPFAERIRGVWEVVRYAKLKGDLPATGFANDKYVIDGKQIAVLPPDAKTIAAALPYRVSGEQLLVGTQEPAIWTVAFNEWHQLVLTRDDAEISLRLVQKATNAIPVIPTRVAVVD
ncbi:MAG: hypothetical protein JWO56_672 [Acidobacteria bacterium]|nr:hypothetical protein [Acidobacteriota bacterium]